jgi:simple sugar transport system permease protein
MTDQHEAEPSAAAAATATAADTGAPAPGRPRGRLPMTGSMIIQAVTEGNSVVLTILAVFVALVIGAVLIAATDPVVLRAWDSFSYAPGTALSATWNSVAAAYSALFEGAIFAPGTISAAFHGGSIAAIFYPLSLTAFEATPLILTGLSVAVAFRAGMFNIGAAGQGSAARLSPPGSVTR